MDQCNCHHHHNELTDEIRAFLRQIRDKFPPEIQNASEEEQARYFFEQNRYRQKQRKVESEELRLHFLELVEKKIQTKTPTPVGSEPLGIG